MRIDRLREAYPNLTDKQEAIWSKTFGIATSVDTKVKYGAITRTDDRAEVDFTLNVSFRYANGTRGSSPPARQHATLQNTSSGWKIVKIR